MYEFFIESNDVLGQLCGPALRTHGHAKGFQRLLFVNEKDFFFHDGLVAAWCAQLFE